VAVLTLALAAGAQQPAAPPDPKAAAPAPLSTPSITGPLSNLPPGEFNAGFIGKISVNGVVSGYGSLTSNYVPGDAFKQATLSNGQIFIQKADGWFQFYVQAGAYNLPSLGASFLSTDSAMTNLYGPVPVAYVKLQGKKGTSVMVGSLPTLIGAEYTFTFQNMNIARGLLWNQEPAISRGVQVNQAIGPVTASVSWNDGFYSNRYNWVSGSLAYAKGPSTLAFVAGGNAGQTAYQTLATPLQNNSKLYNIIYTYSKSGLIIQPYWQYTSVPTNPAVGVTKGNATSGYALLITAPAGGGVSLPFRVEYITSTGTVGGKDVNLLYGPASAAGSFTFTPTYQKGGFFTRAELSYVHLNNNVFGSSFGQMGTRRDQMRAMLEVGLIFGHDPAEKK
jgi:hypothetical protein